MYTDYNHRYLKRSPPQAFLEQHQSELSVSLSCVLYLTAGIDLADQQITKEQKSAQVVSGLHELHTYANDYFVEHLTWLADLMDSEKSGIDQGCRFLLHCVDILCAKHAKVRQRHAECIRGQQSSVTIAPSSAFDRLGILPASKDLLFCLDRFRQGVPSDLRSESTGSTGRLCWNDFWYRLIRELGQVVHHDPSFFSAARKSYQSILEEVMQRQDHTDVVLCSFQHNHKTGLFLCRTRDCPRSLQGFDKKSLREEHENSHRRRFRCIDPECSFSPAFSTRANLKAHHEKYHVKDGVASIPDSFTAPTGESAGERYAMQRTPERSAVEVSSPYVLTRSQHQAWDSTNAYLSEHNAIGVPPWAPLIKPARSLPPNTDQSINQSPQVLFSQQSQLVQNR